MPGISKSHHETDSKSFKEDFLNEGFKPLLMMTINLNSQLCSFKAVTNAGNHYEEFKAT